MIKTIFSPERLGAVLVSSSGSAMYFPDFLNSSFYELNGADKDSGKILQVLCHGFCGMKLIGYNEKFGVLNDCAKFLSCLLWEARYSVPVEAGIDIWSKIRTMPFFLVERFNKKFKREFRRKNKKRVFKQSFLKKVLQ